MSRAPAARASKAGGGKKASAGQAPARKSRARPGGRASVPTRRGPTGSDVLGLVVLGIAVGLAACGWSGHLNLPPAQTIPAQSGPDGEVTVRFLDVGQGDAVLIRSPEGKTILVDGGRSAERLAAHLKTFAVDKLDLVVASHADADHIAGLVAAAGARPTLFINNGLAGTTLTWARVVAALEGAGSVFQRAQDQVINLGSVRVQIVSPPPGLSDEQNLNSVGVALSFGNFRALLTGDSERGETDAWLAQGRPELAGPFQVYKSIHHGASNGDHAAWLARVRPENVVISVGENSYGHPTQSALRLYEQQGARVYRTDLHGTVTFKARSDGTYAVQRER